METRSRSRGHPSRPIGSKLKKKRPAVIDAARAVGPDSSGVSGGNNATVIAKIKKNPDATVIAKFNHNPDAAVPQW